MRIPEALIDEVLRKLDVLDFVERYVHLERKGSRYFGLSPFKAEKTPSFTVDPEKGLYFDFSTGKGGSIFNLVMELDGLSFPEAVRKAAEAAGVDIPDEGGPADTGKTALLELYRRVAGSFHYMLVNRPYAAPARDYLARRGFTGETIERFQIGYAPGEGTWLYGFLRKKGYSEAFLATSGLFAKNHPRWSLFVDRIVFPIYSSRGQVVGFGGRRMGDSGPKYINSPESEIFKKGEHLYGLNLARPEIRKAGAFVLVEGYTDVVALHQAGVPTAVAPLGTAFTPEQAGLLSRLAKRGLLFYDGDEAGYRATLRSASICEAHDIETEVVAVKSGSDPADLLEKEGPESLHSAANFSTNTIEYLLHKAVSNTDTADRRSASIVLQQLFPYIQSMTSDVRREQGFTLLADALGVDVEAVRRDFRRERTQERNLRVPQAPAKSEAVRSRRPSETGVPHDLYLMLAVAAHRELYPFVRASVSTDDLEDEWATELFIALEDSYRRDEQAPDSLFARIEDPDLRELAARRLTSGEFDTNCEQIVKDGVHLIKMRSLEAKRARIEARLRHIGRNPVEDRDEERRLLEDKIYLDGELLRLKEERND